MTVLARRSAQLVATQGRRSLSSVPKMHKAAGNWAALSSKRPIDEDDTHLVFHAPFNKAVVIGLLTGTVVIGWGSMAYGFMHQQYKQGFWK